MRRRNLSVRGPAVPERGDTTKHWENCISHGHPAYLQEIRVEEAFKAGPKPVSQWLERQQCKLALPIS